MIEYCVKEKTNINLTVNHLTNMLNDMAKDNWELIHVIHDEINHNELFIFKRFFEKITIPKTIKYK